MPRYSYTTAGGGGGVVEAPDRSAALREVVRLGQTPTAIAEDGGAPARSAEGGAAPAGAGFSFGSGGLSLPEMTNFMRELSTALRAGLPLVQGLRTIAKQMKKPAQKRMMASIIERVEHGKSLSDAFAAQGSVFGDLTINLTRTGEASGRLGEVLHHAAELLDKDLKLRRSLMAATMYPAIIALLVVGAVIAVTVFIVPNIMKTARLNVASLPWPTRMVQGFAEFMTHWWWAAILGLLALVFVAYKVYTSPRGRLAIDEATLKAPLLGPLMRDVAVARFTRTLATLTAAGIPVVSALRVTKGVLGNRAMEAVIDRVVEQVSHGRTIAGPMEESGYFPPMLVQIVNMGERSGRLEELLGQAAGAFEEKTEQSVRIFTAALPPVLVMIMAGVVGFVVLAILLALLEMQDSVMRG
ncbi:MAG TPA: type II secretion system F family protein [Phycisphaerales bacterium]|nr:type II secretion system F family protein [Phycisphaerales bacterium]